MRIPLGSTVAFAASAYSTALYVSPIARIRGAAAGISPPQRSSPVPTDHRSSNGQQWSGVSAGRNHFYNPFFFNEPVPGTPTHAYKKFREKFEYLTAYIGPISSNIYRQKLEPTLKLSNYKASTQVTHVLRKKAQMFNAVFRDIFLNFVHVFCEPLLTR